MAGKHSKKRKRTSGKSSTDPKPSSSPARTQEPGSSATPSGPKPSWHVYIAKEPESFRKQWKTDVRSPEDVLGESLYYYCFYATINSVCGAVISCANGEVEIERVCPFPPAPNYL